MLASRLQQIRQIPQPREFPQNEYAGGAGGRFWTDGADFSDEEESASRKGR